MSGNNLQPALEGGERNLVEFKEVNLWADMLDIRVFESIFNNGSDTIFLETSSLEIRAYACI